VLLVEAGEQTSAGVSIPQPTVVFNEQCLFSLARLYRLVCNSATLRSPDAANVALALPYPDQITCGAFRPAHETYWGMARASSLAGLGIQKNLLSREKAVDNC
jgi:hypothetical protein